MTKKDYELVASVVKEFMQLMQTKAIPKHFGFALANAFEQHNPKFDRAKFLKACGIE